MRIGVILNTRDRVKAQNWNLCDFENFAIGLEMIITSPQFDDGVKHRCSLIKREELKQVRTQFNTVCSLGGCSGGIRESERCSNAITLSPSLGCIVLGRECYYCCSAAQA